MWLAGPNIKQLQKKNYEWRRRHQSALRVNPATQSLEPYSNHKPYLAFHGLAQLAIGSFTKSQIFGRIFWLYGFSDKTFTPFLPQNAKEKFGYTQISFPLRRWGVCKPMHSLKFDCILNWKENKYLATTCKAV